MGLLTRSRVRALALAALPAALVTGGSAVAAPAPITGKLSKLDFTVIALDRKGDAGVVRADGKRFELVPPSKKVTLHLRRPNGTYAGPIVIERRKKGKRAVLGVKAGARLGQMNVRRGYARLAEPLPDAAIDDGAVARAREGVPIGVRNFGRVRVRSLRPANLGDPDRDGIPDVLDVDDDGDLVLDTFEGSTLAGAAQQTDQIGLHSSLGLPLYPPPNANAPGASDAQIEASLPSEGRLIIGILSGGPVELDCAGDPTADPPRPGLSYCSEGGTGTVVSGPGPEGRPQFPECCDADGDGFGTLTRSPFAASNQSFLVHGATSAQIKTGDVLIEHVATGGDESACPPPPGETSADCSSFAAALVFVFATVPGLKSYSDAAEPSPNSATVYPPGGPTPAPNGPGTDGNGFPVAGSGPGGSGDVLLTLTFWRPQRRPIGTESGTWIDIGRLIYKAKTSGPSSSPKPVFACPQSAYASSTLTPVPAGGGEPGLIDAAGDQTANPNNTITYTLNASQCLASQGLAWPAGDQVAFSFMAQPNPHVPDSAAINVTFRRE